MGVRSAQWGQPHVRSDCLLSVPLSGCLHRAVPAIFPPQDEPSQNVTPDDETEVSPVKRRSRPAKSTTAAPVEKEALPPPTVGGAGKGRKRAADPNANSSAESINIKMSKQQQQNDEGTKRQIDLQR